MPSIAFDPAQPIDLDVWAQTVSVFEFRAQYAPPGQAFVDFGSGKDSVAVSESRYRLRLRAGLPSETRVRVVFLIDGPAGRRYEIRVQLRQAGEALADALACDGSIPDDGMAFDKVEVTLV